MTLSTYRPTARTPDRPQSARTARGQVARQVAGAETIEVKSTVSDPQIAKAMKHIGLKPKDATQRFVYFFDTPRLDLFRARVIVRARRVPGDVHETTVKIRPVNPAQIPAKWKKEKGFKLEADWGGDRIIVSASLTRPVGKGLIKDVAASKKPLRAIFDKDQELFLAEMCRIRYDLDKLAVYGPIAVKWWRVAHPGVPGHLTAELWQREDKKALLETSLRVPPAQAAFANAGFTAFLAEVGACADNAEQAKTRWALTGETPELMAPKKKKKSKHGRKTSGRKEAKAVKAKAKRNDLASPETAEVPARSARKANSPRRAARVAEAGVSSSAGETPPPAQALS